MEVYLNFLRREAKGVTSKLILTAVAAGLFNALSIALVIKAASAVAAQEPEFKYFVLIVITLVGFFATKRHVLDRTSLIVEGILARVRLRLAEKIQRTNLEVLERIGQSPLYTAVSTHTETISDGFMTLVNAATAAFIVGFASLYVISLSVTAFVLTALMLAWLVFFYVLQKRGASENYKKCAKLEDEYFEGFNDLLTGFKELKMNSRKSAEFFETKLVRLSAETQDIKIKTLQAFNKCALIGQGSVFILVASALFILPVITPDDLSKIPAIIAVILFIFGPISEIVSSIPYISRAAVSIQVVDNLESQLDGFLIAKPIEGSALPELGEAFESIVCNQVLFSYSTEAGEAPFSIGPLDFTLRAGEVVFIIGGNGSGKSTFLKVLTGLYPHKSGEFTVNGHLLGPLQITAYRNLFSPIFSDYHLFDKLYGVDSVDDAEAEELIIQMGLSEKTQIIRREISNRKLSTGQRKRLALAVAILEDKPIFLFDEWAADQDPEFRRYFYEKILPELVADGKTVIAATHDDRYFHVANRVLKLEYGKFVPWASPPAGG